MLGSVSMGLGVAAPASALAWAPGVQLGDKDMDVPLVAALLPSAAASMLGLASAQPGAAASVGSPAVGTQLCAKGSGIPLSLPLLSSAAASKLCSASTESGVAACEGTLGRSLGTQLGEGIPLIVPLQSPAAASLLGSAFTESGMAACRGASAGALGSDGRLPSGTVQVRGSPFLKRTPQALHSVRGPSGPLRHCGVWCAPQLRHGTRRDRRVVPAARAQSLHSWSGSLLCCCQYTFRITVNLCWIAQHCAEAQAKRYHRKRQTNTVIYARQASWLCICLKGLLLVLTDL